MDLDAAAAAWRRDGYVVLPDLLRDSEELERAVADLPLVFPSAEEYQADPGSRRNRPFSGDEFGGIVAFPFPSVPLCDLVVCDTLIRFAEAVFATEDIRVYASELWAKYTGAASYEQEHHRDYLNHTPLAPSGDIRWHGLELIIWLCDVPEELGPTCVVPRSVTSGLPALPHGYLRSERPELYDAEISGAGGLGTVVAYSTETFHRGTELISPAAARFSAHVSYRHGDATWLSRHAWGDRSFLPEWGPFVQQASVRQLLLFGFPPPGHSYWTTETLAGMRLRYPGLDLTAWETSGQK
jgi:hypothetical protein